MGQYVKVGGAWKSVGSSWVKVAGVWKQVFFDAATVSSPAATGNYTDANGVNWNYYRFTSSSSITFSSDGFADILLVGGGAGPSSTNWRGSGGCALFGTFFVSSGTQTVTIGAGGSAGGPVPGGRTSLGSLDTGRAGQYEITFTGPIGPGAGTNGSISNSYTGSSVTYGQGGQGPGTANSGNGGGTGTAGAAGVCVVRVRTN